MAAYKIWALVDRLFQPKRRQVAMAEAKRLAHEEHMDRKRTMLHTKRVKTVNRIRDRYHNVMASRIQHGYRNYKMRKMARVPTPSKARRASNMAEAVAAKTVPRSAALMAPLRAAKKLLRALPSPFGSTDLIPEKEAPKIINSVLRYQVKNILQEGLVEMHLTLGEMECRNFTNTQNSLMRNQLPYFEKIPIDLSGDLNLLIYLWLMFGAGKGCICHIEVHQKPGGTSLAGQKVRVHNLLQQGVKVAWNQHVQFELHGICSVLQGKGDFAIQAVKIGMNPQEIEAIEAGGGFSKSGDLTRSGMHASIWTTARKPCDEENLYKFLQLSTKDWFDDRLLRLCKGFNLSEDIVLRMREVYDEIINGRKIATVKVTDVFKYIDYPYTQLAQWVFHATKPDSQKDISFSEYVHMVAYFVMLGHRELMKFLFQAVDTENKQFLSEEQFHTLISILGENSPFNAKGWHLQYKNYYDRKLNNFFIGNFDKFLHKNPGALWQAQALQKKFMQYNIGPRYWEDKMEQFRLTREDLGVRLI